MYNHKIIVLLQTLNMSDRRATDRRDRRRDGRGGNAGRADARSGQKGRRHGERKGNVDPVRRPVILAKPEREREREKEFPALVNSAAAVVGSSSVDSSSPSRTPQVLARREPPTQSTGGIEKTSEAAVTSAAAAQNHKEVDPSTTSVLFKPMPVPNRCVKLIDEQAFCDSIANYLCDDNTDFIVVGVIGSQSAGKTWVINALTGLEETKIFREQSFEKQMLSEQCTNGINVWVSSDRIIYLDTQALLSGAILDRVIVQSEKKYSSEFGSTEHTVEVHSLQMLGMNFSSFSSSKSLIFSSS